MNVLFLTLAGINSIEERGIYQDLLRKFYEEGHQVTIVTPVERRKNISSNLKKSNSVNILQVKTLNITKTNIIEKGIATLAIEYQFLSAIKKYLVDIKFDLILYSTPPITFKKIIEFIKNRDNAYSYLLLKDIFPQNAVDMNMIKKGGFLHRFFVEKEKKLYNISDTIGCMSQANVDFLLKHNREINRDKVEVNPNSIKPIHIRHSDQEKIEIRNRYGIPIDRKVLVYGGNLGKPQGLDFLLETIHKINYPDVFYLIVGNGTEFNNIQDWFKKNKPNNAALLSGLSKEDYDLLLAACDIGLIFLDANFSIPNFPSRLLSYLEMRKPIIAATDANTDIGDIIEKAECGFKVISGDIESMNRAVDYLMNQSNLANLGENAWKLLNQEYNVDISYRLIMNRMKSRVK